MIIMKLMRLIGRSGSSDSGISSYFSGGSKISDSEYIDVVSHLSVSLYFLSSGVV